MNILTLLLLVGALVLFLIAGFLTQGAGKFHFGWIGAACLALFVLIQNI